MSTAKHGAGFEIVWRSADNSQQTWRAKCSCRAEWTGPTYELVEDDWRRHVYQVRGIVVRAAGGKEGRWMPEVTA